MARSNWSPIPSSLPSPVEALRSSAPGHDRRRSPAGATHSPVGYGESPSGATFAARRGVEATRADAGGGRRSGPAAQSGDRADARRRQPSQAAEQGPAVLRRPHLDAAVVRTRVEPAVRAVVVPTRAVGRLPQVARRVRVAQLVGLL